MFADTSRLAEGARRLKDIGVYDAGGCSGAGSCSSTGSAGRPAAGGIGESCAASAGAGQQAYYRSPAEQREGAQEQWDRGLAARDCITSPPHERSGGRAERQKIQHDCRQQMTSHRAENLMCVGSGQEAHACMT